MSGKVGAREARKMAAKKNSIIIRKIEVIEGGGHHGGAWKVAYADFMTAMMAFFLLMWIISSSDEQKLRGVAEFFTNATMPGGSGVLDGATLGPPGTLSASNGATEARGSDLGKIDDATPATWEILDVTPTADPELKVLGTTKGQHDSPAAGAASDVYVADADTDSQAHDAAGEAGRGGKGQASDAHAIDEAQFEKLKVETMQAMQDNPDLRPLKENVIFEKTPEGLRIQIIDQQGKPMFSSGRADMEKGAKILIGNLGNSLSKLPNRILISGHTDAVPFSDRAAYDNWDLSSDRANATRRMLGGSGVSNDRIIRVSGMADTELLVPENPKDATNRRITIMLQYQYVIGTSKRADTSNGDVKHAQALSDDHDIDHAAVEKVAEVHETLAVAPQVFEDLRSALR
jgi:chemotaxis protein MotB